MSRIRASQARLTTQYAATTLYPPGVVAGYTLLSWPVGLALYGLNLYRRGARWTGGVLTACAGALFVEMLVDGIISPRRPFNVMLLLQLLAIPLAFGVFRIEVDPFRKAFEAGAKAASWWHPLLVIAGIMLVAWFTALWALPKQ